MIDWVRSEISKASEIYSDSLFPRAYDPGNNMGNATYSEMIEYFTDTRKKLDDEIIKLLEKREKEGDVWDKRAKAVQNVRDQLPKFGYEIIDYNDDYYYLNINKERIGKMFYRKFGRMRMAYNTITEFNYQLQAIFDNIADKYNTMLGIQAAFKAEFFTSEKDIAGKIKSNIDFSDLSKSDMYSYPHEQQNKKHLSTGEMRGSGVKNTISSLMTLYQPFQEVIKNYLDEYYPLFDTISYADGGYEINDKTHTA